MKKTLKRLPVLFAVVCTLFAASCSDIDVNPRGTGDDDDEPIIISPPKSTNATSSDTLTVS
jgi:hypothetical protein